MEALLFWARTFTRASRNLPDHRKLVYHCNIDTRKLTMFLALLEELAMVGRLIASETYNRWYHRCRYTEARVLRWLAVKLESKTSNLTQFAGERLVSAIKGRQSKSLSCRYKGCQHRLDEGSRVLHRCLKCIEERLASNRDLMVDLPFPFQSHRRRTL